MLRVPRARLLSSARKSYSRWDFLPRVEVTPPREARTPPPLEEALRGHEAPVTIVLVHGAPGSYNDFRHLFPVLDSHPYVRIIGLNLPGYAGSKVANEHYLESISALPTAGLALEAVRKLCIRQEGSDKIFLVGHSFGAHTVINMAALQATETHEEAPFKLRGMALLAPAGCRPHKVLRPRESALVVKLLRTGNPVVSALTPHVIKTVYTKLLGFPREAPPGHYVAGLVRAGTTDFRVVRELVERLRGLRFPALVAWSQDDEFMEEDIPVELAGLCHPGPRLAFASGGHNVQKTRAEQVASAMTRWIEDVLSGDGEAEQLPALQLP